MKKFSWLIFLLLFSLQTTPSYTLELKLKIPKDLKKLGDKVKDELGKKKEEVKKEEVKKEEVKKEEVKKKKDNKHQDLFLDKNYTLLDIDSIFVDSNGTCSGNYGHLTINFYSDYNYEIYTTCDFISSPADGYPIEYGKWELFSGKKPNDVKVVFKNKNPKIKYKCITFDTRKGSGSASGTLGDETTCENFKEGQMSILSKGAVSGDMNAKLKKMYADQDAEKQKKIAKEQEEKNLCIKVDAASTCNKNTDLTETVSFLVNGDLADKNDLNYRHWNINSCVLTRSPPNVLSNMRDTVDNFNKVIMKSMKFYKENNYSYAEADCSGECTRSPTGPDSKFIYQSTVAPERLEKAFIYFSSNFCKGFESKF